MDKRVQATTNDTIVSFDSEELILVNSRDEVTGYMDKAACHDGQGVLHRAFSLFIFNDAGELLLQQRHASKRLWPEYWANTCCSHPRAGETMEEATQRRLQEELGMQANMDFVYKFEYQAHFGALGSEHELCWVYVGRSDDDVRPNATEIAAWRYVTPEQLDAEMAKAPQGFTPWLQMEWQTLRSKYNHLLPRS